MESTMMRILVLAGMFLAAFTAIGSA